MASDGPIVHPASEMNIFEENAVRTTRGGGIPQYSYRNLFQCHSARHKSHMECPGSEPGPSQEYDCPPCSLILWSEPDSRLLGQKIACYLWNMVTY